MGNKHTVFNDEEIEVYLVRISVDRKSYGTSVLNPGAGFLRIFTVAFDRLF